MAHRITISFTTGDEADFVAGDFEVDENWLTVKLSVRPDGEPNHLKIFPLCNIIELSIREEQ